MLVFVSSAPGPVGHLSFTEILDTSLKVSWKDPPEKNGILTGTLNPRSIIRPRKVSVCSSLSCARRISHFLGGIQQDEHSGHALLAEHDSGVPGHGPDRPHYLHHSGGRHDLQRSRSAVVVYHFVRCATRSVSLMIVTLAPQRFESVFIKFILWIHWIYNLGRNWISRLNRVVRSAGC